MKTEVTNYCTYTPDVLKTFMALLSISEPSSTMRDCAKMKSTRLQAEPVEIKGAEVSSESLVKLPLTTWPFPNYASRKVARSADSDMTESQKQAETMSSTTTQDTLTLLMGWMIRFDQCGQCASTGVRFACAYHRIYLCEACKHLECTNDIGAGWEISDQIEKMSPSHVNQLATIALDQLLGTGNPRRLPIISVMEMELISGNL